MNIREHNRKACDKSVAKGNPYTIPVTPEIISAARQGKWNIFLTSVKPVQRDWLADEGKGCSVWQPVADNRRQYWPQPVPK